MKILLLSDIEGKPVTINKATLEGIDLILIAGDITMGARSEKRAEKQIKLLSQSLLKKNNESIPLYFIPGNHDMPFLSDHQPFLPSKFKILHNKIEIINISNFTKKVKIIGFGGASLGLYNNFAFEEREIYDQLSLLYKNAKDSTQPRDYFELLLIHDPPYDTNVDITYQKEHVGSKSIRKIIENYNPNLVVCGHIHESQGVDKIQKSVIINAGDWKFNKNYAIISIDADDEEKISVDFFSNKN